MSYSYSLTHPVTLSTSTLHAALLWAIIFVTVIRVYFTSRPSGLKIIGTSSLLYVLINTSSMVYVLSLYFQEKLNSDSVCFRYFSDGEWIVSASVSSNVAFIHLLCFIITAAASMPARNLLPPANILTSAATRQEQPLFPTALLCTALRCYMFLTDGCRPPPHPHCAGLCLLQRAAPHSTAIRTANSRACTVKPRASAPSSRCVSIHPAVTCPALTCPDLPCRLQ